MKLQTYETACSLQMQITSIEMELNGLLARSNSRNGHPRINLQDLDSDLKDEVETLVIKFLERKVKELRKQFDNLK